MRWILFCLVLVFCSCNASSQPSLECVAPPREQAVPQGLAKCLAAQASAKDARHLLEKWNFIQPESSTAWGSVQAIDVLPNPGDEIVVVYYPTLSEVNWNPNGKLIVFAHAPDTGLWQPVFDATDLEIAKTSDDSLWHNWSYWPILSQDITGDGKTDLLFKAEYYNGHHTVFQHIVALSAQGTGTGVGQTLQQVLNIDNLAEQANFHVIGNGKSVQLQSVYAIGLSSHMTRTFVFDGTALRQTAENLDPPYAVLQLIQTLHRKPVQPSSSEVQQAYALVANAWSHSTGQPMLHPDEQILAEVLLLQLEQVALLNHENDDPNKNPDPQSDLYQQYMRGATRRMWNDALKAAQRTPRAGELYTIIRAAWQPQTQGHLKLVCNAVQHFASEHPDWLYAVNRAAHGLTQINAATICLS